jgi:hypothetical protein
MSREAGGEVREAAMSGPNQQEIEMRDTHQEQRVGHAAAALDIVSGVCLSGGNPYSCSLRQAPQT